MLKHFKNLTFETKNTNKPGFLIVGNIYKLKEAYRCILQILMYFKYR